MVCIYQTMTDFGGSKLGGGPYNGYSPKQTITNYKGSEQVMMRRILRDGWNTQYATGIVNDHSRVTTPFRAVNNLGDFLSRTQYSCGGPNPTNCDGTGVPASSCNVKFVSDSSDFTTFKKQQAVNRNYNDLGFGGYNNGSYVNLMAVRRS